VCQGLYIADHRALAELLATHSSVFKRCEEASMLQRLLFLLMAILYAEVPALRQT
jgi:hypothetical protein